MPHLRYHMLQGVGVFSLSVFFIGNVKSCNNGRSYQKSFHQRSFGVKSRSRLQSMPRKNVLPCEIAAPEDLMSRRLETTPARALQFTMNPKCLYCKGLGWVCENHPHMAWSDELGCHCDCHAMRMYSGRKSRAGYQSGDSLAVENSKSPLNVAPTYRADQARQSLSGVLAHFFRASRMVGKGQPSLFARSRTTDCRRFKAAVARISEAPCATSSLRRSSSSGVQRCINGRISMSEDCCTHRKKSRANPDEGRGSLFGKLASVS